MAHLRNLIRFALQFDSASASCRPMDWITSPEIWVGLLTLTVLEIILGIDNIVFISILAGKLPPQQQAKARQTGLSLALITRVLLLRPGVDGQAHETTLRDSHAGNPA